MKTAPEESKTVSGSASGRTRLPRELMWLLWFAIGLSVLFVKPLVDLARYSLATDLHSHALLIPFIAGYLVWLQRGNPLPTPSSSPALAVIPLAIGLGALRFALAPAGAAPPMKPNDYLALVTLGYLGLLWAGALFLVGWRVVREFLFPAAFLIFIVPMPTLVEDALEVFFQHSSADATDVLFGFSGIVYRRDGLIFELPGIALRVAQECSGIRSSLVLFITSLLAGHMFLKSVPRRIVLTLFVIPLAIVRNGFRIFTIGVLCVKIDVSMIESWVHRRGGPVFFCLSLIPFFLLMFWLRRGELKHKTPKQGTAGTSRP